MLEQKRTPRPRYWAIDRADAVIMVVGIFLVCVFEVKIGAGVVGIVAGSALFVCLYPAWGFCGRWIAWRRSGRSK